MAGPGKNGLSSQRQYWLGSLHRKPGRYPTGLIHRFMFVRPRETGFWIVDAEKLEPGKYKRGKRTDGSGLSLSQDSEHWENWASP